MNIQITEQNCLEKKKPVLPYTPARKRSTQEMKAIGSLAEEYIRGINWVMKIDTNYTRNPNKIKPVIGNCTYDKYCYLADVTDELKEMLANIIGESGKDVEMVFFRVNELHDAFNSMLGLASIKLKDDWMPKIVYFQDEEMKRNNYTAVAWAIHSTKVEANTYKGFVETDDFYEEMNDTDIIYMNAYAMEYINATGDRSRNSVLDHIVDIIRGKKVADALTDLLNEKDKYKAINDEKEKALEEKFKKGITMHNCKNDVERDD